MQTACAILDGADTAADLATTRHRNARRRRVAAKLVVLKNPPPWQASLPIAVPSDRKRPQTRRDCAAAARPCPWVGCRHHLYLDVMPSGSIKLNFPDLEPHELEVSCALDVADRGPARPEDLGDLFNLSRTGMQKLYEQARSRAAELAEDRDGYEEA